MLNIALENILPEEEATGKISELINQVDSKKEIVVITRNGQPAVALIDVPQLESLTGSPVVPPTNTAAPAAPMAPAPASMLPDPPLIVPATPTPTPAPTMPPMPVMPPMEPLATTTPAASTPPPLPEPAPTPSILDQLHGNDTSAGQAKAPQYPLIDTAPLSTPPTGPAPVTPELTPVAPATPITPVVNTTPGLPTEPVIAPVPEPSPLTPPPAGPAPDDTLLQMGSDPSNGSPLA